MANSPRAVGRRMRRLVPLVLALALLGLGIPVAAPAQEPRLATEPDLQAAFLLNFARYTRWPEQAFAATNDPVVFAFLGSDPVAAALEKLARTEKVNRRPVRVAHFDPAGQSGECHVLFLGEAARARLPDVLAGLGRRPVLTVSDLEGFARRGGMVGLVRRAGRIHFEANPRAAEAAGLQLSSRLLQLATVVQTAPAPPTPP